MTELHAAVGGGFWKEYCIAKSVVKLAESEGRLVLISGNGTIDMD